MTVIEYLLWIAKRRYQKEQSQLPQVVTPPPIEKEIPQYLQEYNELLKNPKWLQRKKYIIKKYGCKCARCGQSKPLDVHHKMYWKDWLENKVSPWLYDDDALIPLCRDCHSLVHEQKKPKVYYISKSKLSELKRLYDI